LGIIEPFVVEVNFGKSSTQDSEVDDTTTESSESGTDSSTNQTAASDAETVSNMISFTSPEISEYQNQKMTLSFLGTEKFSSFAKIIKNSQVGISITFTLEVDTSKIV
jgi:hypothetical protein